MKKLFTLLVSLVVATSIYAQAPQKMSYQAVIRNNSNALVTNTQVGMKISILQTTSTGTAVYVETQTPTTNINGLASISIGMGTAVSGSFSTINWGAGPYFIKTETDPLGGIAYTITGTSELMSVPYALYAKTAGTATNAGFVHYPGETFDGGIVFHVYKGLDGLEHGLIVSTTESTAQWQSAASLVNANRTEDGTYNTGFMTTSPAKTYVTGLGAGWYLPSIDELSLLWHNRFIANKALRAGSNTLLSSTAYYWSSTEYDATNAWTFANGHAFTNGKTNTYSVRAVRAF